MISATVVRYLIALKCREAPVLAGARVRGGTRGGGSESPAQMAAHRDVSRKALEFGAGCGEPRPQVIAHLIAQPGTDQQRSPADPVARRSRLVEKGQRNIRFEPPGDVARFAAELPYAIAVVVGKRRDQAEQRFVAAVPAVGIAGKPGEPVGAGQAGSLFRLCLPVAAGTGAPSASSRCERTLILGERRSRALEGRRYTTRQLREKLVRTKGRI